jgi:hypothetical protein
MKRLFAVLGFAVLFCAWTAPPVATQNELALEKRITALEDRVLDLEHPAYTRGR